MFEWLKNTFKRNNNNPDITLKFAPVTAFDSAYQRLGVPKLRSDAGFADLASNLAWVYIANRMISETAAMLPLRIYDRKSKEKKEVTAGYQYDLINNPSNYVTPMAMRMAMFGSFGFSGNSYLIIDTEQDELWVLNPQDMAIQADVNKFINSYIYRPRDLEVKYFDPAVVVHVKSYNPLNYFYGLSPLQAAWAQAGNLNNDDKFWEIFWKEGGRIQGIFTADGALSTESVTRLKEQLKQAYGGVKKMQLNMVLDNGLKFQQIGVSQKDAQLIDKYKMTREEILSAFKVPPSMVGILDQANYSNMEVQEKHFYKTAILPMINLFQEALNSHPVMSLNGQLYYEFDLCAIDVLKQNEKLLAEIGKLLIESGQATPNEVRAKYWDLPPDPNGNDLRQLISTGSLNPGITRSIEGLKKKELNPPTLIPLKMPVNSAYTREFREAESKAYDDILQVDDNELTRKMVAIFRKQKEIVLQNIRNQMKDFGRSIITKDLKDDLTEGLLSTTDDIVKAIRESSSGVINKFGKRVSAFITQSGPDGFQAEWNFHDPRVSEFIQKRSVKFGGLINENTLQMIRDEIAFLAENGASIPEMSDGISSFFDGMEGWRSTMIARTETGAAAQEAIDATYQQNSDVVEGKEWITARDDRVRDSHQIDGQVVALDDDFILGDGESCSYPLDNSLSAENVINCRCTTVPVLNFEGVSNEGQ